MQPLLAIEKADTFARGDPDTAVRIERQIKDDIARNLEIGRGEGLPFAVL